VYTTILALVGFAIGVRWGYVVGFLVAAVAGWIGSRMDVARDARKHREGKQQQTQSATRPTSSPARGHLRSYRGMYIDLDIVGESYRQDAIRQLWRGPETTYNAALIPENDNPHDSNAVRVEVEGCHVGYLSRETAEDYRDCMNDEACQIPVHLVMGGDKDTIGVFPGRSKADQERMRDAAAAKAAS
jgi:HIRAN domain-containing protein